MKSALHIKSAHAQEHTSPPAANVIARLRNPGARLRPTIFEQIFTNHEFDFFGTHPQINLTFTPILPR